MMELLAYVWHKVAFLSMARAKIPNAEEAKERRTNESAERCAEAGLGQPRALRGGCTVDLKNFRNLLK
jgi:hypothetical protein